MSKSTSGPMRSGRRRAKSYQQSQNWYIQHFADERCKITDWSTAGAAVAFMRSVRAPGPDERRFRRDMVFPVARPDGSHTPANRLRRRWKPQLPHCSMLDSRKVKSQRLLHDRSRSRRSNNASRCHQCRPASAGDKALETARATTIPAFKEVDERLPGTPILGTSTRQAGCRAARREARTRSRRTFHRPGPSECRRAALWQNRSGAVRGAVTERRDQLRLCLFASTSALRATDDRTEPATTM